MTNARDNRSARDKAAALRAEAAAAEQRRRRTMITVAVLAVVAALVAVVVIVKVAQDDRRQQDAALLQPPKGATSDGLPFGPAGAKVTVDVWEDFMCPYCGQFELANDAQLRAWVTAGTVRVVYHPVAILDEASTTGYSTRAANASAAVYDASPTSWQDFHKALYENQPAEGSAGLPDTRLVSLATAAGAPQASVQSALDTKRFVGWTGQVTDAMSKAGLQSTPTVLVNGTKVTFTGGFDPAQLKAAVDAANG